LKIDKDGQRVRALGLCSGGLDSLLALLVVQNQGIEVTALTFVSPFLDGEKARDGSAALGIPHRIVDFTPQHLKVVKDPKFGYGANMNPCLDCHILMIRLADEIRSQEGYHFIFTGEVVGQRPMSQNRAALDLVAKNSGAAEYLVRPLSAKRLPPTRPEEEGWLERERLLGLQGRGRKPQMALAQEYGITDYPSPAGGCILTDPGFSRRLRRLFEGRPDAGAREVGLLYWGRHFDLGGGQWLILGRDKADNEALFELIRPEDIVLQAANLPGPLGLIPGPAEAKDEILELAGRILLAYTKASGPLAQVSLRGAAGQRILDLPVEGKESFEERLIL